MRAAVERMGSALGIREPRVDHAGETPVAVGGIEYRRSIWVSRMRVGPAASSRGFLALLESEPAWPTLVIDSIQPRYGGIEYRPANLTVSFSITTRASDESPESQEEYERLIADRGAASAFSCDPLSTPTPTPAPSPTDTPRTAS